MAKNLKQEVNLAKQLNELEKERGDRENKRDSTLKDRVQMLKGFYEEEFQRAADQDSSRASLRVAPALSTTRRA